MKWLKIILGYQLAGALAGLFFLVNTDPSLFPVILLCLLIIFMVTLFFVSYRLLLLIIIVLLILQIPSLKTELASYSPGLGLSFIIETKVDDLSFRQFRMGITYPTFLPIQAGLPAMVGLNLPPLILLVIIYLNKRK